MVDQCEKWRKELEGSWDRLKKVQKLGNRVVKRYTDEREELSTGQQAQFRLNLFHSNIKTVHSMLYGNLPKVAVNRTEHDFEDDIARVAAIMMQRLLNNDITCNANDYDSLFDATLLDRLLPGLGVVRVRYEMETEEFEESVETGYDETGMPVYESQTSERLSWEDCIMEYVYWEDVSWSWARTWADVTWIAFRSFLTKDEVKDRFGAKFASEMQFSKQKLSNTKDADTNNRDMDSVKTKAEVWEIWDKDSNKVYWWNKDCSEILDEKDDPLGLENFFPCPPFFMANPTTRLYIQTPDFYISQDLYNEIDTLQSRIAIITEAVRVVGVYDSNQTGVQRMMKEGTDNDMIPVDNWAMFAEKGGLKGVVDWFPILDVVNALDKLTQKRDETIALLFQVTGLSDIMRGAQTLQGGRTSATADSLKAKYGSVRMQALQDQWAKFVSDAMQLKCEVIAKHFEPQTIIDRSNIMRTPDANLAEQAVELIKQDASFYYRVEVKSDSLSMVDYAQLKQERVEYINALATFMQSAVPMTEQAPQAAPMLLKLLQWGLAGFKGSQEIEGVIDQFTAQLEKSLSEQQGQGRQDPEAARVQAEAQADMQRENTRHQNKMRELQAQMQAKTQEHQQRMAEIQLKAELDVKESSAEHQMDLVLDEAQTNNEIRKDDEDHDNSMAEIRAQSRSQDSES